MKKGLFITFEGGEGSGKTTIINRLVELLSKDVEVVTSREPGGVRIAEEIRNIILDPNNTEMCSETEALLFAASRMQHLKEKVIPALLDNKLFICDRYLDSSLVYQGYCRGLGFDKVLSCNSFALDYLPDLTFFIDVTPEVGLKRLKDRSGKIDRLDKETISFHQKVYDGYVLLAKKYPERIVRVDGNRNVEEIVKDIYNKVMPLIK